MSTSTIVAIGPLCWGTGKTQDAAVRNAKRNMPGRSYVKPGKRTITVYAVESFMGVTGMGAIIYRNGTPEPREIAQVTVTVGAR